MNRETRTFLYGLMMMIIGAWVVVVKVNAILDGSGAWYDWIFLFAGAYSSFGGIKRVHKTI